MAMRVDSRFIRYEFESQHWIQEGQFFTVIFCKKCIVCLKKTKNKHKKIPRMAHLKMNF